MTEHKFILDGPIPIEETRHYEFKEVKGSNSVNSIKNKVDEYVVAFLNSEGGRIFFGIRDEDRVVVGVKLNYRERDELRKQVINQLMLIQPPISPSEYRMVFHEVFADENNVIIDLFVVEVIVPRVFTRELYSTGGREFFLKTDSGKKRLSALEQYDEIKRRAIREEEQKLTETIFKKKRNYQLILTLTTIALLVGVIGSVITIWRTFNPTHSGELDKMIKGDFINEKNESSENKQQENLNTEKRIFGKEKGKVAIVRGPGDGYLNLRDKPTIDSEVIESAFRGEKVIILEYGKEWSLVRFKGKIGYMATEFLIID